MLKKFFGMLMKLWKKSYTLVLVANIIYIIIFYFLMTANN